MRRALLIAALPLLCGAAPAVDEPHQVTLTIYNNDIALVRDVRQIEVPAGRTRLEFKNVSSAIRPETVVLTGGGLSVVEQNFDYDLLTPAKMMEKAVGRDIQIVRTNPATGQEKIETATVLSVNAGVVLKIGDRIEVLRDDGIPTRVVFDGIPENLRARPTLSVTVDARNGGKREATLTYLTRGITWVADYVAQYDEKAGTVAVQGWITLRNLSGTTFDEVQARLVAGAPSPTTTVLYRPPVANVRGGTGGDQAGGDFPVYPLPGRVTVAQAQSKQTSFLALDGLKTKKTYDFYAGTFVSLAAPQHAFVTLSFSNAGSAMPAGNIRVYMRDDAGESKFVGEQRIDHTPGNSDLAVRLGNAFDVTVQSTVVSTERLANNHARYAMRYEIRNAQNVPVEIELRQGGLGGSGTITNENIPGRRIDGDTESWTLTIPAHGETILTASMSNG
jgi:hypothetical protein